MKKFEYTIAVVSYQLDLDKLNHMGSKGWELVSFYHAEHAEFGEYEYIFKREIC